jgi:hypothetical protein
MLVVDLFNNVQDCIQQVVDFRGVFIHWTTVNNKANALKAFDLFQRLDIPAGK